MPKIVKHLRLKLSNISFLKMGPTEALQLNILSSPHAPQFSLKCSHE